MITIFSCKVLAIHTEHVARILYKYCNVIYNNTFILTLDINECNLNADDCHQFATCNNTLGSFECGCNVGYEGDGVNCRGIHCLIKSFAVENCFHFLEIHCLSMDFLLKTKCIGLTCYCCVSSQTRAVRDRPNLVILFFNKFNKFVS